MPRKKSVRTLNGHALPGFQLVKKKEFGIRTGEWIKSPCISVTKTHVSMNELFLKQFDVSRKIRVHVGDNQIALESLADVSNDSDAFLVSNDDKSRARSIGVKRIIDKYFPETIGGIYRAKVLQENIAIIEFSEENKVKQ